MKDFCKLDSIKDISITADQFFLKDQGDAKKKEADGKFVLLTYE